MVATVRIAAEHGSFSRIRQVAPCIPRITHGSLGHASLQPSPKRYLDRFSCLCTVHQCD